MAKMVAVELGYWRRHSGPIMVVAFLTTTVFFKSAFRWNTKSCYTQYDKHKYTII
jgi:hypothetical protein